ncbi:MAG: putative HTH-type transcriptional regulator LgoR [Candidatus Erwinia impunctatus]|nr:putative HTH-type transcriptional regulator LgoR [Culicoides impunctatus]
MSAFRFSDSTSRPQGLAQRIYQALKDDIFAFRLMPGDNFSENEIAERMAASRTPVRQALFWLEHENYVQVHSRSGWQVRPFDFNYYEALYDFRIVLEREAVLRLCQRTTSDCQQALAPLIHFWLDSPLLDDSSTVSQQDEQFHIALLSSAGNPEMTRVHREITEKIRIIRHLDFTREDRIAATYREHQQILQAIIHQQTAEAQQILTDHILQSKAEVRKITLHML